MGITHLINTNIGLLYVSQFARLKQQFQQERKKALDRPATRDELAGLATKWGGKLF